jgi:hypothetical protein
MPVSTSTTAKCLYCQNIGGFPGHREAEGATSLADLCAAQGREARQGPRRGELPAP